MPSLRSSTSGLPPSSRRSPWTQTQPGRGFAVAGRITTPATPTMPLSTSSDPYASAPRDPMHFNALVRIEPRILAKANMTRRHARSSRLSRAPELSMQGLPLLLEAFPDLMVSTTVDAAPAIRRYLPAVPTAYEKQACQSNDRRAGSGTSVPLATVLACLFARDTIRFALRTRSVAHRIVYDQRSSYSGRELGSGVPTHEQD